MFHLTVCSPLWSEAGRNPEVGTEAETREETCFLVWFLIQPRSVCPLPTAGWALLHQSLIKINAPQTSLQANLMEVIPQRRDPLPRLF